MPNPMIPQGTLNRLRAAIQWPSFPVLNITAPFLGKEGIRLAFGGVETLFIDTMTGAVTSPEPYQLVTITINLLKTQPLANLWKAQEELSTLLGDATVRPDAAPLAAYSLINCAIENVPDLAFDGSTPAFPVIVRGYRNINSSLWNL